MLLFRYMPSPMGQLLLAGDNHGLQAIGLPEGKARISPAPDWCQTDQLFDEVIEQLNRYFAGELRCFDLPLSPHGTAFQLSVLEQLQKIPYGETRTYGQIARALGRPRASRAVGAANGRNPVPIIIPCHRVIGSDGSLTGFGGGLAAKKFLLQLESAGR